jgi:hypothetical protein
MIIAEYKKNIANKNGGLLAYWVGKGGFVVGMK